VNEYELLETIGKGAFSKIKKCKKENSKIPLAVKVCVEKLLHSLTKDCQ